MVNLPSDYIVNTTLKVGRIYKLKAPELITTDIPHFFIVIGIDDDDNFMVLCTSQKEKKLKYFNNNHMDLEGLVFIKPSSENQLTKKTYVDCNRYYEISRSSLKNKVESHSLEIKGEINLDIFYQIKQGIVNSDINDLPEFLIVHPDE